MKAILSEEYYYKYWDKFLEKIPGDHYRNLEEELEHEMKAYINFVGITEDTMKAIRTMKAREIADSCRILVHKEMDIIKRIEAGKASFGFTTETQEWAARKEFRLRFEFNCLQLRDFKAKYCQ